MLLTWQDFGSQAHDFQPDRHQGSGLWDSRGCLQYRRLAGHRRLRVVSLLSKHKAVKQYCAINK